MRILLLASFLAAPLLAQTAVELPTNEELAQLPVIPRLLPQAVIRPQLPMQYFVRRPESPRTCSIPLTNVLKRTPQGNGAFRVLPGDVAPAPRTTDSMPQVKLPAPPCQ